LATDDLDRINRMTQRLIILGTSGNAYDVLDVVEAVNRVNSTWSIAGFLDDGRPTGVDHLGFPVLGRLSDGVRFGDCLFINAIGSDRSFRRRAEFVASTGVPADRFATLVHPAASVSSRARLGRGVCVNFGASIAGAVAVGDHASIGPRAIIGHDTTIGPYTVIAPGAVVSGFVRVGRSCYIGAGAAVRQQLDIADEALIGMGAVVVRSVSPELTVIGNPARPMPAGPPSPPSMPTGIPTAVSCEVPSNL
jgi:sugar O-acyltransferase (sialic acid O-acetyltransferase NeuD family)